MASLATTNSRRLLVSAAVSIACALAAASPAQADIELRWKFTDGEKTYYEMKTEMNQEMKIGGIPIEVKANQQMDMSWIVSDVQADGSATVQQTIDRLRMEMSLPVPGQEPIKYDSREDKLPPGGEDLGKKLKAMVGHPFTLKVTPTGKVTDFKAPPELLEAFKDSPAGGMFSEDGLKQMLSQSMLQLPAEAIATGKTWDTTMEMKTPPIGKLMTKTIYTYAGQEERDGKKLDKIDVAVNVKNEGSDDNAQIKIKDNQGGGVIYWDNTAGRPIETTIDSKMTNEVTLNGNSADQTVTTKVSMKRVAAPDGRDL